MGDVAGPTPAEGITGREPVVSTGRRATYVREADLATRLSDLASVTAALFNAVHVRGMFDSNVLGLLVAQAELLADQVQRLQSTDRSTVRSFSELVPLDLWDRGISTLSVEADLAGHLRDLLAAVQRNDYEPDILAAEAERFDEMAETFRGLGRERLLAVTERASNSV